MFEKPHGFKRPTKRERLAALVESLPVVQSGLPADLDEVEADIAAGRLLALEPTDTLPPNPEELMR